MTPAERIAAYEAALAASDERLAAKRRDPAAAEHYRQRAEVERNACPF